MSNLLDRDQREPDLSSRIFGAVFMVAGLWLTADAVLVTCIDLWFRGILISLSMILIAVGIYIWRHR